MSELGDTFKEMRQQRRDKKASNLTNSVQMLQQRGVPFKTFNGGIHLRVCNAVDYWPSTGLWMHNGKRKRGVFKLLHYLKEQGFIA